MTDKHTDPVVIELWTDLGCPWCYLGKHRLDTAIAQRPDADRFELRLRSFELDPSASETPEPVHEHLAGKYGASAAQVQAMEARIRDLAVADGLEWSELRSTANSFAVHRLLKYADTQGVGTTFFTALQDGYFAGTLDPFDPDQLVTAATASGLDAAAVRAVLAGDDHADEVRADEAEAQALGATGVPFTVYGRRFATAGAQSVEGYGQVLEQTVAALAEGGVA
ncbi:DsbA family oxidoreductase [Micropruina sonneratiae]|uniref:DsbA family oxidoreductase n=1 Tax=Micropruina sonneratiae TaxID=2986940 RepID=UPI002227E6A1|nr:DsbA family oxidoreductase [Micropruina sp. KQZ13P-5]MCW3157671.1 DsbA family oxidoreductase [Micropruina sp. KQZ13P-5]